MPSTDPALAAPEVGASVTPSALVAESADASPATASPTLAPAATREEIDEATTLIDAIPTGTLVLLRTDTRQTHEITQFPVTIGRSNASPVAFPDVTTVSREHVQLRFVDGRFSIKDLGSLNGTKINEQPIEKGLWMPLSNGDTLTLADVYFVVIVKDDAAR